MSEQDSGDGTKISQFTEFSVDVKNMGGIDTATLTIDRGVTVFTGQNATNRTSMFHAIAGVIGGSAGVLKSDTESGYVSLTIDGDRYTRRYSRSGQTVRTEGTPYTDEEELIDLFVCLLEDNPIRQALRAREELSELLLAPVDTEQLKSQIAKLQSERSQIDERLTEIERERKRLPKLEERRQSLQSELDDIESELETVRKYVESIDTTTNPDQVKDLLSEFEQAQEELERTESELETQRTIREGLEEDLKEVRNELSELDVRETKLAELDSEIDQLQGRESELSATISELSTILKQNRDVLTGDDAAVEELAVNEGTVSKLNPMSQSLECWTCGSQVERQAIADRLEDIEELVQAKRTERKKLRETLSERRARREAIEENAQRYEQLQERESELERELKRCSETIEELTDEAETLRKDIADHQERLSEMDDVTDEENVDELEQLSELEYKRGQVERELKDVEDNINEIEYSVGKYDDFEVRRSNLTDQIQSLRSRVNDLEKEAVDTFNEHMASVLNRLAYDNIERVWVERRKADDETTFDLHIVRENRSGSAYEDVVDHLSESEREVVGLVIALAGYLTHDVEETVPLLLLDSLEAIDGNRIAELVDYFQSHTDFLLLALLEGDAAELPESYDRVYAEAELTNDGSA